MLAKLNEHKLISKILQISALSLLPLVWREVEEIVSSSLTTYT